MIALVVAFGSSTLRQSTEGELALLQQQVDQLHQINEELRDKIRWWEGRYDQSLTLSRRLNQAFLEEQQRNHTLANQLHRYSERAVDADIVPAR